MYVDFYIFSIHLCPQHRLFTNYSSIRSYFLVITHLNVTEMPCIVRSQLATQTRLSSPRKYPDTFFFFSFGHNTSNLSVCFIASIMIISIEMVIMNIINEMKKKKNIFLRNYLFVIAHR